MLQTFFGIATVAYLCLGAAGSGLAGVAASSYIRFGARFASSIKVSLWTAIAFLLVGMGCLFFDLGKPLAALNISLFSNSTAWATRGFWLLFAALLVYALLLVVISRTPSAILASHWSLYKRNRDIIARVLAWFTIVLSVFLAFYTGLLLYESLGVPFWRTLLLPALFFCGSANIGLCLFLWFVSLAPPTRRLPRYRKLPDTTLASIVVLLVEASFLILYLVWTSNGQSSTAAQSFDYLVLGKLALLFWLGIVLAGLLIPLLITLLKASSLRRGHTKLFATIIMVGTVIGLMALRYGVVFSGFTQY